MSTHILYIPGLGDRYDGFRRAALRFWNIWNVTAKLVPIKWYDGENMEVKLARVAKAIEACPNDARIVLIGESAGATLALATAESDTRVHRVITLCGVARQATPVSSYLRRKAPALDQGVKSLGDECPVEIHSIRALVDGVVGKRYSVASGATEHVVWSIGHLTTITLCLTLYSVYVIHLAKQ